MEKNADNPFGNALEMMPTAIAILQKKEQFGYLYVNPAWRHLTGYSESEAGFMDPLDIIPTGLRKMFLSRESDRLEGGDVSPRYELKIIRKDGQERWVDFFAQVIDYRTEKAILTVSVDITGHKRIEEKLQQNEVQYRTTLDTMLEGCQIIDRDWRYVYVNDTAARQGRHNKEEMIGNAMPDLYPGIDKTTMFATLKRCVNEQKLHEMENHFVFPDGSTGVFKLKIQPIPEGLLIRSIDLTDIRRTEKVLAREREFKNNLLDVIPIMLLVRDSETGHFTLNTYAEKTLGWTTEEAKNIDLMKNLFPDTSYRETVEANMQTRGSGWKEWELMTKEGTTVPFKWINVHINESLACIGIDLREYKHIENVLHESEKRQSVLLSNLPGMAYFCKNERNWPMIFVSQGCYPLTGYSAAELISRSDPEYGDLINNKDRKSVWNKIQHSIHDNKPFAIEYRITDKKGNERWVWEQGRALVDDGTGDCVLTGFVADITERKRIEELLREKEEKYRFIADNALDCIWQLDMKLRFLYLSPSLFDITGFKPEEWIGTRLSQHTTWREFFKMARLAIKMLKNYKTFGIVSFETEMYNKDGELIPLEIISRPLIVDGELKGLQGSTRSIEERKRAEKQLRQSEERWQFAIEGSGDGLWDWNPRTNEVFYSDNWKKMLGYKPHEINNTFHEWKKRIHPDDLAGAERDLNGHLHGNTPVYINEHRLICKDGSYKWILDRGKVIKRDKLGRPVRVIGTHSDITARKNFEFKMKETHFGIEQAQIGVYQVEEDGIITYANRYAARSVGYSQNELKGMSLFKIDPEFSPASFRKHRDKTKAKGSNTIISVHRRKDGSEFPVEVTVNYFKFYDKLLSFSFVRDITDRVNAEEELRNSESRFRLLAEAAPIAILISDRRENTLYINKRFTEIFGYTINNIPSVEEWWPLAYPDPDLRHVVKKKWIETLEKTRNEQIKFPSMQYPVTCKDGSVKHIEFRLATTGELNFVLLTDVTEKYLAEEALHRIEWMLRKKTGNLLYESQSALLDYGDLTILSKNRLILDAVGPDVLKNIASDYLTLLESSSAIYEKNGDYALGIFSSGWCRFMDQSSRKLCNTKDNRIALSSGKWLCHESCWTDASSKAMQSRKPVDIECNGGIRLYAIPILMEDEVIGAINFGYGNPPQDEHMLNELSGKYQVPFEKLAELAKQYEPRPDYIINIAKERLLASANLIAEIVRRKKTENELCKLNAELGKKVAERTKALDDRIRELERFHDATIDRELRIKELKDEIKMLKRMGK